MKRTVYDAGLALDCRDIPPEVVGGQQGGKMLTVIATENNEQISFSLPPSAVAELHEMTKPPSKLQAVTEMPDFLKPDQGA